MPESSTYGHIPVLLHESIETLDLKPGDIFVDGTLGSGGHSEAVALQFGTQIRIVGIDADADALARAKKRFKKIPALIDFVQDNFRNLDQILDTLHIEQPTKILLDLGLSSNQFEESGRGFSFQKNEPLEMTFKKNPDEEDLTATVILNEWQQDTLEAIFRGFGEEQYAKRIAQAVVNYRAIEPITTTTQLVNIILEATPSSYHHRKIHPATKTFQALRIAVNDELGSLEKILRTGFERLAPGGRMAVISFHSLEDRIVKKFFKQQAQVGAAELMTKKPITPSSEELDRNRRARSAKLRVVVKK